MNWSTLIICLLSPPVTYADAPISTVSMLSCYFHLRVTERLTVMVISDMSSIVSMFYYSQTGEPNIQIHWRAEQGN